MEVTHSRFRIKGKSLSISPPPTRSTIFVQMSPQLSSRNAEPVDAEDKHSSDVAEGDQGRKGQRCATGTADRKTDRKSAHRLIEKRRRDKINEAYAILQHMIPACTGSIDKLGILQVCSLIPTCYWPVPPGSNIFLIEDLANVDHIPGFHRLYKVP